ncbi:S9 family peptidase [Chitinimonas sp. BJYL2]|uniref:S9 family peptidase n=1 Tax=Chitinimonas sp. BJYL2 TaxID=2976696 RepID=UPI0022B5646F|nr:S9 family peptidase [Chitinimonas sp. BJYL2]
MSLIPPVAPRRPVVLKQHGDTRIDDYLWLRERDNPEVLAYLQAENAYADAVLAPLKPLQDQLYDEIKARIKEDDSSVPYRLGHYRYYSRFHTGQQYPVLCRQALSDDAPEEVLLDVNALARGREFMAVGEFEISPDGHLLAYTTDSTGYRQYQLRVKDLRTGKLLVFKRDRVTSVAWALDNDTLFFTTEDKQTKRSNQLWRHTLSKGETRLIHEEKDERFGVDVYQTRSEGWLVYQIGSHTTSEIRLLPANRPTARWKTLLRRKAKVQYTVDHRGEHFWLRINDQGRNYRLVTVPVSDPAPANWTEILPERADVMLEGIDLFKDFLVCHERINALNQLVITDLRTQTSHTVAFDEPAYSLGTEANAEWDTTVYRFSYESMTLPETVYDYDMATRVRIERKRRPVLGDFDPARYTSERIWANATDGTRIPISLVYRKDQRHQQAQPMWLEGYGAYGIPNDVYFSSARLSLLDRGVIYAVAHVRGGGDLGETWHDAGKMQHKMNSYTDFIACAEHLFAQGYTAPDRLIIEGGSAGGLLMGAVINLRPDLCRLAILDVPFLDALTTMQDASLPLTVGEYEEWGNPNKKTEYGWIRAWSPYDMLRPGNYPALLVKTAFNDSQVMYWEPAKYVAKLRTLKTDPNPLLFMTNMGAGHGGASGRFDRLREIAVDYSVALTHHLGALTAE